LNGNGNLAPSERIMVLKSPFNMSKNSLKLESYDRETKKGELSFVIEAKKNFELTVYLGAKVKVTDKPTSVGPL